MVKSEKIKEFAWNQEQGKNDYIINEMYYLVLKIIKKLKRL